MTFVFTDMSFLNTYPSGMRIELLATRALPLKQTTLNTTSLALLPVGRTRKSIKRFCCITSYDKYAHERNRAKGKGDPLCSVWSVDDSLLHILCVCNRPALCHLRSDSLLAMTDLMSSWGHPSSLLLIEDEMWQRYLSNVTRSSVYDEECWLSVHSDSSLLWRFGGVPFVPHRKPLYVTSNCIQLPTFFTENSIKFIFYNVTKNFEAIRSECATHFSDISKWVTSSVVDGDNIYVLTQEINVTNPAIVTTTSFTKFREIKSQYKVEFSNNTVCIIIY